MATPATETIPVVDLRVLTQDELSSLALSCPNAFDLHRCDDVVVPKIDRSVFNESAGSRKQTYSRLRLAPHCSDPSDASSSASTIGRHDPRGRLLSSSAAAADRGKLPIPDNNEGTDNDPGHRENLLIISYLRQLFACEEPSSQTLTQSASISAGNNNPNTADEGGKLDQEAANISTALVLAEDNRDGEVLNGKGEVVDLIALGEKVDPFAEALRQRTAGLKMEEQLLVFMGGLDGQWGSRRRRRRIVDASLFGDHLPMRWKLLLALKRKEGDVWVYCRRYVSPSGKHFLSCKEVSLYILSLLGHPSIMVPVSTQNDVNIPRVDKVASEYPAGSVAGKNLQENHISSSVAPISVSADLNKQIVLYGAENQAMEESKDNLACQIGNLTFGDKSAHLQHQLSFHQRNTKRRKIGKLVAEGVILKDGKYECQFCHKTFDERHRYNGHVGAHVRYQGVTAEKSSDKITSQMIYNPCPLSAVPYGSSDSFVQQRENTSAMNLADGLHVASSQCILRRDIHEVDCNPQDGELDYTELLTVSKVFDDGNNSCDVTHDNPLEVVQSSNVLIEKSDAPIDAVTTMSKFIDDQDNGCDATLIEPKENVSSRNDLVEESNSALDVTPSSINANNAMQSLSPAITQEDTTKRSIGENFKGNDSTDPIFEEVKSRNLKDVKSDIYEDNHLDLVGHKSEDVLEACKVNVDKCFDSTCTPTMDIANMAFKSATDLGQSSSTSTFLTGKTVSFDVISYIPEVTYTNNNAMVTVDMANISKPTTDIGQSSSTSISVAGKNDDYHVVSYLPEVTGETNTIDIKPSACENSFSTCHVSGNIADCENSVRINVSSMAAEAKEFGRFHKLESDSHLLTLSDNGSRFSAETYTADIFGTSLHENILVEMDTSKKTDFVSSQAFPDKDAVAGSSIFDQLNASCINVPFVGAHTSGSERNVESTFDIQMKEALFEVMHRPGNELDSCFRDSLARVEEVDAGDSIQHDNQSNSLHVDLSLTSPWAHSSNSIPMTDMISNQECRNEISIVSQKHNNIFGFEQLGVDAAESSTFLSLTNQETMSGATPHIQLGYATELENRSCSPVDLGWGLSLPSGGSQLTSICVWCSREFSHPVNNVAEESDSLGFICLSCKAKITGQFSMLGPGSTG